MTDISKAKTKLITRLRTLNDQHNVTARKQAKSDKPWQLATVLDSLLDEIADVKRQIAAIEQDELDQSMVAPKKLTREEYQEQSKLFFESDEWYRLRYKVIETFGARCMACGRHPPEVTIHVDHILPRSKFPERELDIDNLQILCLPCNAGKSNIYFNDWRTPEQKAILSKLNIITPPASSYQQIKKRMSHESTSATDIT